MFSEESANYSDAQSSFNTESTSQAISSDEHEERKIPQQGPKHKVPASHSTHSESLFLAVLFGAIALLLPTFFYFASKSTTVESAFPNIMEVRSSSFTVLNPYIPTISTIFRAVFSAICLFARPLLIPISIVSAIISPVIFVLNVVFQAFLVWPYKLVVELVQFFYPIYVFCGVACLLGAGVGVSGRALIEGGRMLFADTPQHTKDRKSRKKLQ